MRRFVSGLEPLPYDMLHHTGAANMNNTYTRHIISIPFEIKPRLFSSSASSNLPAREQTTSWEG